MTDEQKLNENSTDTSYELNTELHSEIFTYGTNFNSVNIDTIKKQLKDPMSYNAELRKASRILYNSNGIYSSVINYKVSLPTLDRVVHGRNRNHKRFKENRDLFSQTLHTIDDKKFIRDGLFKGAVDGTAFWYFETKESHSHKKFLTDEEIDKISINQSMNASIIPLPTDYCRIIGTRNASYEVAFDLSYFDELTGKGRSKRLKRYPKEIRKAYDVYRRDRSKKWHVLDYTRTLTLKVRAKIEEPWGRPIGLAAFIDMLYDEYFTDTKRNVLDNVNTTIVYQTFPEGDSKGKSSLNQKQQEAQHNNIKHALFQTKATKGINFFSVAAGTKLDTLKTDVEILKTKSAEELITRIATNLGFASSLLNAEKGSMATQRANLELITSEIFSWIEQLSTELNKVINHHVIKDPENYIEVYYLPITLANRDKAISYFKDLYMNIGGSRIAYIAAAGVNPDAYLSLMEYEREEGFDEKFPPHATSYTTSGNIDNKGGRPLDNESDNENTIKNKNSGQNPS